MKFLGGTESPARRGSSRITTSSGKQKRSNNSLKSRAMKRIQSLTRVHCLHTDWGVAADCEAKAVSAPRDRDLQGNTRACQVGEQPLGVMMSLTPALPHTSGNAGTRHFRDGEGLHCDPRGQRVLKGSATWS